MTLDGLDERATAGPVTAPLRIRHQEPAGRVLVWADVLKVS